jgi:hypothetical protein
MSRIRQFARITTTSSHAHRAATLLGALLPIPNPRSLIPVPFPAQARPACSRLFTQALLSRAAPLAAALRPALHTRPESPPPSQLNTRNSPPGDSP